MTKYQAILMQEKDGRVTVTFPDFPKCATMGNDLGDAIEMAQEALGSHVEEMRFYNMEIPEPTSDNDINLYCQWIEA